MPKSHFEDSNYKVVSVDEQVDRIQTPEDRFSQNTEIIMNSFNILNTLLMKRIYSKLN